MEHPPHVFNETAISHTISTPDFPPVQHIIAQPTTTTITPLVSMTNAVRKGADTVVDLVAFGLIIRYTGGKEVPLDRVVFK